MNFFPEVWLSLLCTSQIYLQNHLHALKKFCFFISLMGPDSRFLDFLSFIQSILPSHIMAYHIRSV